LFYMIGLPGQTGWLALHILWYASVTEWFWLLFGLLRGTLSWIRQVMKNR
jgi:hypothetical protein